MDHTFYAGDVPLEDEDTIKTRTTKSSSLRYALYSCRPVKKGKTQMREGEKERKRSRKRAR